MRMQDDVGEEEEDAGEAERNEGVKEAFFHHGADRFLVGRALLGHEVGGDVVARLTFLGLAQGEVRELGWRHPRRWLTG